MGAGNSAIAPHRLRGSTAYCPLPTALGSDPWGLTPPRIAMSAAQSVPNRETASPILAVKNIEVIYDHVILVLKGVSLEVQAGGIVALLGANGAGKSTTLKAISNLIRSERGEVTKGTIEL